MKIDFSQINKGSFADAAATGGNHNNIHAGSHKETAAYGFKLDISGKVMDNAASSVYAKNGVEKGQGRTIEECLQGMSGLDMSIQHNYMAVMSNSLSAEDFAKLKKDGFHVSDMSPQELVTVTDQIKIKLAEAGVSIAGFNDDIDSDTIEAASGGNLSQISRIENALKENDLPATSSNIDELSGVLKKADELNSMSIDGRLSDESIRYMLDNNQAATLENVYMSQFKSQQRPTAVLNENELNQLQPQMEQVIIEAGMNVDAKSLESAKWLIENQLPLTADTLSRYEEFSSLQLPADEGELLNKAAICITRGDKAESLNLIHKERILSETMLGMTAEANLKLLMSGVYIDTTALKERVEELNLKEQMLSNEAGYESPDELLKLALGSEPVDVYNETLEKSQELRGFPAVTAAEFIKRADYSLDDVYLRGRELKATYDRAGESYEALRTEIRPDLGDNIQKAFTNAEDILREMSIPSNEGNLRAVRILGYNSMEITPENIAAVKEADNKVCSVIDKLTPGAVLSLIREGKNPLTMNMAELSSNLDNYNNSNEQTGERYGEYIWKLEKNKEITEEEKESYIGIYRLFRQVEKSDGAVIGGLVNQGAELTVKNLLSAVRSRRAGRRGIDVTVDDEFAGLEAKLKNNGSRIDDQILSAFTSAEYYESKNRELLSKLDPEKLRKALDEGSLNENTSLEELIDVMDNSETPLQRSIEKQYYEEEADSIRQAMDTEESIAELLSAGEIPVTPDNLMAMNKLIYERGDVFRQLRDLGKAVQIKELIREFETKDGALAAMDELVEEADKNVAEAINEAVESDRISELRMLSKEIRLTGTLARQENYEIPVELDGELTAVNLKIVHGSSKGNVEATLYTDFYGPLSISLKAADNIVSGYMVAASRDGEELLKEKQPQLEEAIRGMGMEISGAISVMRNHQLSPMGLRTEPAGSDTKVSSETLYALAKTFLEVITD